jgi:serine/threonine-protein kinase
MQGSIEHQSSGSTIANGEPSYVAIGDVLGGFRVESRLGDRQGTQLFSARHTDTDKAAIVRVFSPALAIDRAAVERCFEEAQAVTEARHPGFLETFDVGFTDAGKPFQIVELIHGASLEEAIQQGVPFSVARALAIAEQLAATLSAAHVWGLVHGVLSPRNVFVSDDDRVKIAGFGMSKLDAVANPRTSGAFFGLADFMAPEQIVEPGSTDARADIYAIGAILYTMLAGASPFAKVPAADLLRVIAKEEPKKLRDLRPELRVSLGTVVNRAMRSARDQRYAEMQDFIDAMAPLERTAEPISSPAIAVAKPTVSDRKAMAALGLAATIVAAAPPPSSPTPMTSVVPSASATPAAVIVPVGVPVIARPVEPAAVEAAPARAVVPVASREEPPSKRRGAVVWLVPAVLAAAAAIAVIAFRSKDDAGATSATTNASAPGAAPPSSLVETHAEIEPVKPASKPPTTAAITNDTSAVVHAAPVAAPSPPPVAHPRSAPRTFAPHAPPHAPPHPAAAPNPAPPPVAANPPAPSPAPTPPKRRTSADLEPY